MSLEADIFISKALKARKETYDVFVAVAIFSTWVELLLVLVEQKDRNSHGLCRSSSEHVHCETDQS